MAIVRFLGAIGLVAGFIMLYLAYSETQILQAALNPSAVQVTQVYSEASFYVLLAIACFVFAVLMTMADVAMAVNNLVYMEKLKRERKAE
jgi:hypothetical protein